MTQYILESATIEINTLNSNPFNIQLYEVGFELEE